MRKHPKLKNLNDLFKNNERFSLSDAEYEAKTGARLPKDSYYLLNHSALANKCSELGFTMKLQEKVVSFERVKK